MKLFIKSFSHNKEEEILEVLGNEFECQRSSGHVVIHKMETNESGIPNISECISV